MTKKTAPLPTVEEFNPDLTSVLTELEEGHYLFLIVDSKKASFLLFENNKLKKSHFVMDPSVMKKIKSNSGELLGRNTKLMNRRDHQLTTHLKFIMDEAMNFVGTIHLNGVFIGGHQPLFHQIESQLPETLKKVFRGTFVTELNIPEDALVAMCLKKLSEYTV
jgi:hypothetical protein